MKIKNMICLVAGLVAAATLCAQEPIAEFGGLARMRSNVKSKRVGSYDRSGGNFVAADQRRL